jgi:predicted dehydrogenase
VKDQVVMPKTLRVGIIGTGRAGQCHAAAYSRLPGVSVKALWNRTRSSADELASTFNVQEIKIFDDWHDLVDDNGVDLVSITTDPVIRLEPLVYALGNRIHALVEKPLASSLADAETMTAAAEQADTVTAISLNWRYSQACRTMWSAIREGRIGRPLDIQTEWRLRFTPGSKPLTAGRSLLTEMGSHEFDRACFLSGQQFRRVVCSLRFGSHSPDTQQPGQPGPPETFASVMAEMSDGMRANFRFSLTEGEPERRIILSGEHGTLILVNDWVTLCRDENSGDTITLGNELRVTRQCAGESGPVQLEIAKADKQHDGIMSGQHTWNQLIADFVSAVRSRHNERTSLPHLPQLTDGLSAQRVINACELSHAEQRWVDVEPPDN